MTINIDNTKSLERIAGAVTAIATELKVANSFLGGIDNSLERLLDLRRDEHLLNVTKIGVDYKSASMFNDCAKIILGDCGDKEKEGSNTDEK